MGPGVHEGINEGISPAFETSVSIPGRHSSRNSWIESSKSFMSFSGVCCKTLVKELCPPILGVESKSRPVETNESDTTRSNWVAFCQRYFTSRDVSEMTHEDADVVSQFEASPQRDQVVEKLSTIGFPPITHHLQETVVC